MKTLHPSVATVLKITDWLFTAATAASNTVLSHHNTYIRGCYGDYSSWQHRDMFCSMIGRLCPPSSTGTGLSQWWEKSGLNEHSGKFCRRSANNYIKKYPYVMFVLLWRGCILDLTLDIVDFLLMLVGARISCSHLTAILDSAVNRSAWCAFWSRATLLRLANLFNVSKCNCFQAHKKEYCSIIIQHVLGKHNDPQLKVDISV